ncbi:MULTISPECIES: AraC family transcriptional regulator [unclassified Pseudomonas]|uniref:AraC family transcriptional regulator n=1 Tax=unclassified Pseudomonas TaxID=196821 RepID=UPI00244BBB3D|nr:MULTISPECIES: AraC family transcriptional regulator [unclassified Pseudomonas]MDG9927483.1 AraC family transcriptional regulator [Pseudomonas sp. GD04042]MDH0482552.1 AraC family transcriptional regulator [Pseudomonas sp. GD04015]MDH0602904.1 AraC family transcriptional regulator [Pseudomonas sp. GD03869]
MSNPPSVTVHYAQAILQAAERLALPLPAELRLLGQEARIPLARQEALWEAFCVAAHDPLIGLRLGSALQVGHLDMVGALLMSCETLGEALEALLEYYPIVGEGGEFGLVEEGDQLRLVYLPHYQVRREERVEAVLASLVHMARWITGERIQPLELHFAHPPRAAEARYIELLGCPLCFGADDNALVFDRADLGMPLIQANALMREHLRGLADSLLERLGNQSLAARVQQLLRQQPRWGKERIAEQLELSGRHLNRKLADEGTSFKLLRDQVLHQMAEQRLRESPRVAEVAEGLGFSDESAFAKAFRRWSGITPGQFRQGLGQ